MRIFSDTQENKNKKQTEENLFLTQLNSSLLSPVFSLAVPLCCIFSEAFNYLTPYRYPTESLWLLS